MSSVLKPWTRAAFELIVHAEGHLRNRGDFDRRMAHIGFDNAIEVAIGAYLGLNPLQRQGKTYQRDDVQKWLANFHTKLQFLENEAQARGWALRIPNDEITFYHDIRNMQYHTGGPGVPEEEHLLALRAAALDTFAMLFGVPDVEHVLEHWLELHPAFRQRDVLRHDTVDRLLDMVGEPVLIAGQPYAVSEALYATDPESYQAVVAAVVESRNVVAALSAKYPEWVRPDLGHVGFVHYGESVYLKTVTVSGEVELTDTESISGTEEDTQYFSSDRPPDENAELLVRQFDAYSIINCFELFTSEASAAISKEHQARLPLVRP